MENQEAESGAKMGESGERIRISEQKRNLVAEEGCWISPPR